MVAAWFSAGLRIYDIRDPFRPEEIAAFLPETPDGQRGCRISDCFVDDRGIIYAADRARGGIYVLEYTGDVPLTQAGPYPPAPLQDAGEEEPDS